jgi:ferredoxin
MATVFIHYFSGTGNTKRAVEVIAGDLQKNGFEVKQFTITNEKPAISENADFNIFAFSTLSWSAPALVKKYLHRLPKGQGKKAAVFAVYAGDPGQAILKIEQLLGQKGFEVFLSGGALYPNNWSQMTNPPTFEESKEKLVLGDNMAQGFAEDYCNDRKQLYSKDNTGSFVTRIVAFFFGLFGRRFLGKAYIADSNCNACGLCVKSCPVHTIKLAKVIRKKPYWKFNCEDCARCINICPQKAIQVSMPKLFLHFLILFAGIGICFPIAGWAVSMLPEVFRIIGWIVSFGIALLVVLWLQFVILDRFIFFLEQIRVFQKIFEKSLTKNYNRYTAPGYKPDR